MNIKEGPFNRKHCPNNIAPVCLNVPCHREAAEDGERFMIAAANGESKGRRQGRTTN